MELRTRSPNQSSGDLALDTRNTAQGSSEIAASDDVILDQSSDMIWRGGEHNFEGLHDRFCFSCGASENIVGCQTCRRCYHPQCMFPPLDICQIPDIWFCPVCVGRNWHMPLGAISTPPTTLPSTSVAPTPRPSGGIQAAKENEPVPPESENPKVISHTTDPQRNDEAENQSKRWREVQRWKENAWFSPRGYILDPSCPERFISLSGEEPISLSTVMKNRSVPSDNDYEGNKSENHSNNQSAIPSNIQDPTQGKIRRTGKGVHKSPPRKRSKYSDLPKDIEKALDLITNRLEEASRSRRWQDDVDGKARAMEQKVKIQEGEVLLCRQELHTVKQQLLNEVTTTERLRAENADLREKLEEARTLAERKENEMKNWQAMLRTVMGSGDGPPLS